MQDLTLLQKGTYSKGRVSVVQPPQLELCFSFVGLMGLPAAAESITASLLTKSVPLSNETPDVNALTSLVRQLQHAAETAEAPRRFA